MRRATNWGLLADRMLGEDFEELVSCRRGLLRELAERYDIGDDALRSALYRPVFTEGGRMRFRRAYFRIRDERRG